MTTTSEDVWDAARTAAGNLIDATDNLDRYVSEVAEAVEIGARIDRQTVADIQAEVTYLRRGLDTISTAVFKTRSKHGW